MNRYYPYMSTAISPQHTIALASRTRYNVGYESSRIPLGRHTIDSTLQLTGVFWWDDCVIHSSCNSSAPKSMTPTIIVQWDSGLDCVSSLPRTDISTLTGSLQSHGHHTPVIETISLLDKTLMEMAVSTMYTRPHEFFVLSTNIDVFCAKIQLPVIQHTFTFAGDHIVDLWWEQALLRLTNHDSGTIMPATEGSDVVKAGGSGLEVNKCGITHNKHPEGVVPQN